MRDEPYSTPNAKTFDEKSPRCDDDEQSPATQGRSRIVCARVL